MLTKIINNIVDKNSKRIKYISFIMREINTFGFDKSRYQSCESKIHMLA